MKKQNKDIVPSYFKAGITLRGNIKAIQMLHEKGKFGAYAISGILKDENIDVSPEFIKSVLSGELQNLSSKSISKARVNDHISSKKELIALDAYQF